MLILYLKIHVASARFGVIKSICSYQGLHNDTSSYAVWSENNHTNTIKLKTKNNLIGVKVLVNSSYVANVGKIGVI
jgi:hypothetical protein